MDLVPFDQMQKMAAVFANSKMFGCKTPDEAMAIMLLAQSEGLHPATAARDYHIIQGRPAMKADAMLSRYLQSGGKVVWIDYTDAKVSATFSHPAGGTVTIDWDQARATKAGLGTKDNWKHYPRQMLRARVISEGVRTTNPGVAVGIYTEAEVEDMVRTEHDMGTAEIVPDERAAAGPPPQAPHPPGASVAGAAGGPPVLVTPEEAMELEAACDGYGITAAFKTKAGIALFSQVPAADLDDWRAWIKRNGEKRKATA